MRYSKISVWDDMSSRGDGIVNYIPSDDDYQITSDALSEGIVVVYEHNDRSSATYFVFIPETSQYFNLKLIHSKTDTWYMYILTLKRLVSRYIDSVITGIINDALSRD
jgi:hypothetical protein